ncbi:MAG TPA: DUF1707 domain-containing protein [Solirubrobacteraceae bacterium]|nr:DUF1707 domain-containing protein [Solirubrobacteraceae bacterium]
MPPEQPGPGRIRLGDADRERLLDALARHHAEGRLTIPQLEERVTAVYAAQTRAEATAVLADLPPLAGPPGERPGGRPRRRRYGEASEPGAAWVPTPERFRDPRSGRIMRVWTDPASGSRHYVPDEG